MWIWSVQQMIVNFSSFKVIHSAYPWLLHIISMRRGNGRSNYCGLQTWHPPSLKQPSPGWWDSVWAFRRPLLNEFLVMLRTERFKRTGEFNDVSMKAKPPFPDAACQAVQVSAGGNLTNPYIMHISLFLTKQPPVFIIIPLLLLLLLSVWLWKSSSSDRRLVDFPAFFKTICLPPSWHSINKSTPVKLIKTGVSCKLDLFVCLFFKNRHFPKCPQLLYHICIIKVPKCPNSKDQKSYGSVW